MIIKCRVCQEPLQHTPDRPHSTCTNVACSNHRVPVVTVPYEQVGTGQQGAAFEVRAGDERQLVQTAFTFGERR